LAIIKKTLITALETNEKAEEKIKGYEHRLEKY